MHFNLGTDGHEFDDIIVRDGGFRNPFSEQSLLPRQVAAGITRNALQMELDGLRIFNFALREVAPNITELLREKKLELEDAHHIVFHQANLLMLESVRKKLKLEAARVPYSLYDYGNTSSASIPVTLVTQLREELIAQPRTLLLSGFGVGLSWGSVWLHTEGIVCPVPREL